MYICESETSKSSDYGQAAFKLRINPGMREGMLKYMINIVLSDKLIAKEEVDLLYEFGSQ